MRFASVARYLVRKESPERLETSSLSPRTFERKGARQRLRRVSNAMSNRRNLRLPDRPSGLDIDDHTMVCADEVVFGKAEECWSLAGCSRLACRIGMGCELRLHFARGAECRFIQGVEVLAYGTRCVGGIDGRYIPLFLGVEFCLFASASIRLASMAMRCPLSKPSSIHRATVESSKWCRSSLSRKRPCRFLKNVE